MEEGDYEVFDCGSCGAVFSLQDESIEFFDAGGGNWACNCPECDAVIVPYHDE